MQDTEHSARYRNPCGYSDTREDSDLCAQWTAARAADSTGPWYPRNYVVAIVQAACGLLTLLAAVAAAVFAKRAAEETKKGADAAVNAVAATNAANEISQDTAKRQLRAYIHLNTIATSNVQNGGHPAWRIQAELKNSGQTPAVDAASVFNWIVLPNRLPEDFAFMFPREDEEVGPTPIGPGTVFFTSCSETFPHRNLPDLAHGRAHGYIWGAVDYWDVFGKAHRTEFASKIVVTAHDDNQYGINWETINRHNAIDEDCLRKLQPDRKK